jgi:quinol-cytochrome oxidoreductase complex cytochrome b subunit
MISPGILAVWLLVLLVVSGVGMTFYYNPTAELAASSVAYMHMQVVIGDILHNTHRWSALLLLVFVTLHALRVYVRRAYLAPRDINWWLGLLLLLLIFSFGATGYILRWDIKAFTLISLVVDSFGQVPVIGRALTVLLLGGAELDVVPLYRGYAFHVWLLPAVLIPMVLIHLAVVLRQGLVDRPPQLLRQLSLSGRPLRVGLAPGLFLLLIMVGLASRLPHEIATDATTRSALPHPDWLLLVYILPFWVFRGRLRILGTLIVPALLFGYLIIVPKLYSRLARRWFKTALIVVGVAGVLWLLTQVSAVGAQVPMQGCSACHRETIVGDAPLTLTDFEVRDPDWLVDHLKDPPESLTAPFRLDNDG